MTDAFERPASTRLLPALVSVAAASAGLWVAAHHPLAPTVMVALFALWVAVVYRWPWLPLFALPALLPVVDLAPWTGWLTIEEFDLLVVGAMGGGYARLVLSPSTGPGEAAATQSFALTARLVIGLYLLSQGVGLYRGVVDAGGFAMGWTQGYDGPMNSFRIAKSLLLAVGLLPLVGAQWRSSPGVAQRALVAGLVGGLVAASLAVVWERLAFTDLVNFSTDYRTTALFWEMHVGGAALDGFVALTLPFAVWAFYRVREPAARLAVLGALVLGAYAALTTFSRGVYLATALSVSVLAWLVLRQQSAAVRRFGLEQFAINAAVAVAAAGGAYYVFRGGGYRATAAMVVVAALTLATAPTARSMNARLWIGALAAGILAGALGWGLSMLVPKGPYVVFAVLAATAVAAVLRSGQNDDAVAKLLAVSAYVAAMLAAVAIARHWGGPTAFRDAAAVAAILIVLWLFAAIREFPGWPNGPSEVAHAALVMALAAGLVAVFSGGAYMGDRFATAERDLGDRLQHWRKGLDLLATPEDWLLGRGLGRFPSAYFFGAKEGIVPGGYRVDGVGAAAALTLSSPSYSISFGDAFRISQRVAPVTGTYAVQFDVRAKYPVDMHVEICEKHLLYSAECAIAARSIKPDEYRWQRLVIPLDVTWASRGRWFAPRLSFFSIFLETSGRAVELDNVSLIGPNGNEALANGDFSDGMAHWFFTSDRFHLPWHIKSLPLNVLFEQGLIGLFAFLCLVGTALWRLVGGLARSHPLAPPLAASILGFLVVGAFDSLLDVPRVAFLFYLLLFVSLAIRPGVGGGRSQSA